MKNKLHKVIDVVTLGPYWEDGALLVSIGNSKKELRGYIDEVHKQNLERPDCPDRKHVRTTWKNWKMLLNQRDLDYRFSVIDSKADSTRASVFYDTGNDFPCLLLVLSSDFNPGNPEHMITLAHEILHVCQRVLPIYLRRDEEHEAEAYFHSHLMRKVIEML